MTITQSEFDRLKKSLQFTPRFHVQWGRQRMFCETKSEVRIKLYELIDDPDFEITVSKVIIVK